MDYLMDARRMIDELQCEQDIHQLLLVMDHNGLYHG